MTYNRRETIKATAEWQSKQNYTHFATATFQYANNFTEEQVMKTLRYFFNAIGSREAGRAAAADSSATQPARLRISVSRRRGRLPN